jgi:hypothetical protein
MWILDLLLVILLIIIIYDLYNNKKFNVFKQVAITGPRGLEGPPAYRGFKGDDNILPGPVGEQGIDGPIGDQGDPIYYNYYKQENTVDGGIEYDKGCRNLLSKDGFTFFSIDGSNKCVGTSPVITLPYEDDDVKIISQSFTLMPGSIKINMILKVYKKLSNAITFATNLWYVSGKTGETFNVTTIETVPIEFRPTIQHSMTFNGMGIQRNMNGTLTFFGPVNRTYNDYIFDNFRF